MTILEHSSSSDKLIDTVTGEVLTGSPRAFSRAPGAGAASLPPLSKTGVKASHLQEVVLSADWSTVTIHEEKEVVFEALRQVGYDVGLEAAGHGTQFYRELYKSPFGVNVQAVPVNEHQTHCVVALTGRALEHFGAEVYFAWGGVLARLGQAGVRVNPKRVDLAFDTQKFTVQQVVDADRAGLLKTAARARGGNFEGDRLNYDNQTYYIGSRESEALVRVYHKTDGCSFGAEAFTRVELELHGDRAAEAFWSLMAWGLEEMAVGAARLLNGFMDIETDWWQDFKLTAESAWLKLKRKVATIASKKVWLRGQVEKSLAVVVDALDYLERGQGWEFLNELLADGRKRYSKVDEDLIKFNSGDGLTEFMMPVRG